MTARAFGLRVFYYTIICFALLITLILILNWRVRVHNVFVLPKKYTGVILGNSHAACGFDDQFINGYVNLSAVTESYLYIYIKLKEVLDANPQIKDVILEVDNMQFSNATIKKWHAGSGAMSRLLPKYEPYMSLDELSILLEGHPSEFMKNQQLLIQKNFDVLRKPSSDQITTGNFGRNSRHKTSHADSLLQIHKNIYLDPQELPNQTNIKYLTQLVNLCKERNVSLLFVRIPVLKDYEGWTNELVFQKALSENFSQVPFVDLGKLPLLTTDYYDIDHLNIYGSEKLSKFLNEAIDAGLTKEKDLQHFIDMRIDSLNVLSQ